jgi:hypothetical protein
MSDDMKTAQEDKNKLNTVPWGRQIRSLWSRESEVQGLLRIFDTGLLILRFISVSYWLKDVFCAGRNATEDSPAEDPQRVRLRRDNMTELYCVGQLLLLLISAGFSSLWVSAILALYVVFEVYLNLLSILFIPRRETIGPKKSRERPSAINEPSTSVERNLLLVFVNVVQVLVAFAIFYRYLTPTVNFGRALLEAILVFGTVGYSERPERGFLIAVQILLDFVLIVAIVGSFESQVKPLTKRNNDQNDKIPPYTPTPLGPTA